MDISSMLEVQVNEVKEADSKENVTPKDLVPSTTKASSPISQEESNFYKLMFGNDIASVRFRRLHCTACDVHIGSAPAESYNMYEHPVLRTLLCAKCRDFYGDGTFEQGDDATDMFCRWCANGGNLYCCSYCSNTFCYKCIMRNFDRLVRKKIEADEKWKCFVCNPSDLYTARAVCWALLQHVQTVTRILHSDRRMTAEQINEKMNLDESQCCPRRRRQKRRRTGSNSEDDDKSYIPKNSQSPIIGKRKIPRKYRRRSVHNGFDFNNYPVPIQPRVTLSVSDSMQQVEMPILPCVQSTMECDSSTATLDGRVVPPVPVAAKNSHGAQPPVYNANMISPVPTASLLQNPPPLTPLHTVLLPPTQSSVYPTTYVQPTPMVSIPNKNTNVAKQPRLLLPKPKRSAEMLVTPHIIEIDSDSDEPTIVEAANDDSDIDIVSVTPRQAVPVALVSSGSNTNEVDSEDQPLREVRPRIERDVKTFTDSVLLPRGGELKAVLAKLKKNLCRLTGETKNGSIRQDTQTEAYLKVKQFYRDVRRTVFELAKINDRAVREYNGWKRSKDATDDVQVLTGRKRSLEEVTDIPLDMICINESDAETDDRGEATNSCLDPSELIESSNALTDLVFLDKRNTVDRGVGDETVSREDKSAQVYDVLSRDYEKCIGYSLLMKADYDPETRNSTLRPVAVPSDHFGKYEEQFISYLQHIEDHGIETDDAKGLPDPNETPLKDLIEANSPFISEMLGNMDMPLATSSCRGSSKKDAGSRAASPNDKVVEDDVSLVPTAETITAAASSAVDELVKIVTKVTDDLNSSSKGNVERPQEQDSKGCGSGKDETVSAVNALMDDENVSKHNSSSTDLNAANEEDCTIIDD